MSNIFKLGEKVFYKNVSELPIYDSHSNIKRSGYVCYLDENDIYYITNTSYIKTEDEILNLAMKGIVSKSYVRFDNTNRGFVEVYSVSKVKYDEISKTKPTFDKNMVKEHKKEFKKIFKI